MTFVILQAPGNGYYWLIKAASDKHFELIDQGFDEIDNGEYEEMLEKVAYLEWNDFTCGGVLDCITLKKKGRYHFTYYRNDDLEKVLAINPDFFDEWDIVDSHDWFRR